MSFKNQHLCSSSLGLSYKSNCLNSMVFKFLKVCDSSNLKLKRRVKEKRSKERKEHSGSSPQTWALSPELAPGPRIRVSHSSSLRLDARVLSFAEWEMETGSLNLIVYALFPWGFYTYFCARAKQRWLRTLWAWGEGSSGFRAGASLCINLWWLLIV